MQTRTIADHPDKLNSIIDVIHDCWFDVEAVRMSSDGALEIPFGRTKSVTSGMLKIYHVKSFEIKDVEKVRKYDFDSVLFDSLTRQLRITTGIPLEFRVHVDRLEIVCEGM